VNRPALQIDPASRRPDHATLTASTKAHYEAFPFIEGGPERVRRWASRLRRELPDELVRGALILDVGSSTGEVAHALADRGARPVCLDLTERALRRCREAQGAVMACQADALALPFGDGVFDHSIAIGVLHHTPDTWQGLAEMARVTRRNGRVAVLLYSRRTPYELIYHLTGPVRTHVPVSRLHRLPGWTMPFLRLLMVSQIHLRLDDAQLKRMVADQLWTPRASFHSAREIRRRAAGLGLRPVGHRWIPFYSNLFVFEREPWPSRDDASAVLVARTRAHYERFPFVEGGQHRVRHWMGRMRDLLPDDLVRDASVLDVGCGSGEVARGLEDRGGRLVCLDLTEAALRRIREREGKIAACQGDALALPFAEASFDHAVAIGVLHHTPDVRRCLQEMARVTRPGGRVVVLLYARWTPYHLLYLVAGPLRSRIPVEALERVPRRFLSGMRLVVAAQVHQRLDDRQLRRLLADQLWTPHASFHPASQVRRWAASVGLRPVRRHRLLFHANLFAFERQRTR
jgi:ubiquinone/menaquinone biosynthesis C-methylase UbiE